MMHVMILIGASGFLAAALLGGCAGNDGLGLTTASLQPTQTAAKPSVDPACVTLAAKINEARAEGTPGRFAQVATAQNKSRIVKIKRDSLAKVAELDKMNEEFQARCSTVPTQSAAAAPASAAAQAAAAGATRKAANNVSATAATSGAQSTAQTARKTVTAAAGQPILSPAKSQ